MPLLELYEGLVKTTRVDYEMRLLADRHYSRETHGHREFLGPSKNLVLRDAAGLVLFAWTWPMVRMDNQSGFNCAIFRNESERLSSEIILEAEQHAINYWGPNRMYTYVDAKSVRSSNPGYCFRMAGWHTAGHSKSGRLLLVKN